MYRLYYAPRSASFLAHAALEEIGAPFQLINPWKELADDYQRINPMKRVPALETADGILTEGQAIVTYLAIRHPGAKLLPPEGDALARARAHEILNLLSSAHLIAVQMISHPDWFAQDERAFDAIKDGGASRLRAHMAALESILHGRSFAAGSAWSIADANILMVYRWARRLRLPLADYPTVERIALATHDRPAIRRAMTTEGITLDS